MTKTFGFRNQYGALSICSGVALGAYSIVHLIHIFDSDDQQAPIRPDVVHAVHTGMNKNRRQPYAV